MKRITHFVYRKRGRNENNKHAKHKRRAEKLNAANLAGDALRKALEEVRAQLREADAREAARRASPKPRFRFRLIIHMCPACGQERRVRRFRLMSTQNVALIGSFYCSLVGPQKFSKLCQFFQPCRRTTEHINIDELVHVVDIDELFRAILPHRPDLATSKMVKEEPTATEGAHRPYSVRTPHHSRHQPPAVANNS